MYWEIVGSDKCLKQIRCNIEKLPSLPTILVGKPGSGKTWIAKSVASNWEEQGGIVFYCIGDKARDSVAYAAIESGVKSRNHFLKLRKSLPALLGKTIDTVLGTRTIFTEVAKSGAPLLRRSLSELCITLDENAANILTSIDIKAGKKPILFIADNLHWWDHFSLILLSEIVKVILSNQSSTEFIALSVLLVFTDSHYQPPSHRIAFEELCGLIFEPKIEVPLLTHEKYRDGLKSLGLRKELHDSQMENIESICGYHLPTISKAIDLIENSDEFESAKNQEDIFRRLIEIRSKDAKKATIDIVQTLKCASLIGLKFLRSELICIRGNNNQTVLRDLSFAKNLGFIDYRDNMAEFVHEAFHAFFRKEAKIDEDTIYCQLDSCLQKLKPGDYVTRARVAFKAGFYAKAADLFLVAISRDIRYGRIRSIYQLDKIFAHDLFDSKSGSDLLKSRGIYENVSVLIEFWDSIRCNDYEIAKKNLSKFNCNISQLLEAERDYCFAIYFLATRSSEQRSTLLNLLEKWENYSDTEPELWYRLMAHRVYALSMSSLREEAKELAVNVEHSLISRKDFDPSSEEDIHTLARLSSAYYPSNLALLKLKDAYKYFSKVLETGDCSNPAEYVRVLNNYGALLSRQKQWSDAKQILSEGKRILQYLPQNSISNPAFLESNLCFCLYRSGSVPSREVVKRMQKVILDFRTVDLILLSNYISFLVLDNQILLALEALSIANNRIKTNSIDESFVIYRIKSLEAICTYLIGKPKKALKMWKSLNKTVSSIPYASRASYLDYHRRIKSVFQDKKQLTVNEFDEAIRKSNMNGNKQLDEYYSYGIFITIIVYWRHN